MSMTVHRLIRFGIPIAILAASVCQVSARTDQFADITAQRPDAFYDPPADRSPKPGVLLREEPLRDVTLPAGLKGWRILYTTTVDDGTPATAVATVFAPIDAPPGPRSVIMWEHGTTGLEQKCMPSLSSAPTLGIPALEQIVKAGWVIVATDYSFTEKDGPHPYLIGEGEARAGLDSVRAARQMPQFTLDRRTVVWGHSEGGHAALWTGIVGPRYAPDVPIAGIAAIAPPGDPADLLAMNPTVDRRFGSYVARSYSRFYPDIEFAKATRRDTHRAAREIGYLCSFVPRREPERIAAILTTVDGGILTAGDYPALAARLAQNGADQPIAAPLLIAQGLSDDIVLPAATNSYVERRCAAGQRLEYWTFVWVRHAAMVQQGSALANPLIAWTQARFANQPQTGGCTRRFF